MVTGLLRNVVAKERDPAAADRVNMMVQLYYVIAPDLQKKGIPGGATSFQFRASFQKHLKLRKHLKQKTSKTRQSKKKNPKHFSSTPPFYFEKKKLFIFRLKFCF